MAKLMLSPASTFVDPELKPLLDMYRRVVAQRYTPCNVGDLPRLLAAPPFYVSRKIDGELWFLICGSEPSLVAANGRTVTGGLAILEVGGSLPSGTVLVGELHVAREGARERVGDVGAALAGDGSDLCLAVFDLIRHGDITWRESTFSARLELLRELVPGAGSVSLIPVITTDSEADVAGQFQDVVDKAGGEGIVVRCSDGRALKVKPELTLDLVVLGFTSRDGSGGVPEARSLLIGLAGEADSFVPLATVGNFAEGIDRSSLLDVLESRAIGSQYRRVASTGQLYQMIRPELIVECRVMDIQAEDSKGRPILQPQVRVIDDELVVTGRVTAVTLINPLLLRSRGDKASVSEGARWAQIESVVARPAATAVGGGASEVIRRQVWTKMTKDKTDVRKLVVWKTNKDEADSSFPPYVVHWTDYSAGRKTPLTREVRPAPTLELAESLADAMISENIKKGWEERHG